jgi:hypothetical protein
LKKKFNFLNDYSDSVIKQMGVDVLIKAEVASRKLQDLERGGKAEDKLLRNREAMQTFQVEEGTDNRLDNLHRARCLPGAVCSAGRMWLFAREVLGPSGHPPLSSYDLASFGLGGCVSARGWVEIHNPSSTSITIRMFSMGGLASKIGTRGEEEWPEVEDLNEFKGALRVLRGAMVVVHPWNRSVDALESFYHQTNYCISDLFGIQKPAQFLRRFTDYILLENAARWRDREVFITTREMRGAWADFSSQKGLSAIKNQSSSSAQKTPAPKTQTLPPPSERYNLNPSLFLEDICVLWNLGKCSKATGSCKTSKGKDLRHVCNHRPDKSRPDKPCGKNHPAHKYH